MRHLATSVVLGNVRDKVTLVHNAVTNDASRSVVRLGVKYDNRGYTWVLSPEHCRKNPNATECVRGAGSVSTITLDDLLTLRSALGGRRPGARCRVVMKVDESVRLYQPNRSDRFYDAANSAFSQ